VGQEETQKEEARITVIELLQNMQAQVDMLEQSHAELGRIVSVVSQALEDKGLIEQDDYQSAYETMVNRASMLEGWKQAGVSREEAAKKLEEMGDNPRWVDLAYKGDEDVNGEVRSGRQETPGEETSEEIGGEKESEGNGEDG